MERVRKLKRKSKLKVKSRTISRIRTKHKTRQKRILLKLHRNKKQPLPRITLQQKKLLKRSTKKVGKKRMANGVIMKIKRLSKIGRRLLEFGIILTWMVSCLAIQFMMTISLIKAVLWLKLLG